MKDKEEVGPFPKVTKEDLLMLKGRTGKLIFGTINIDDKNLEALKEMFYNPEAYNIIPFDNIWDEGDNNKLKGYFIPSYKIKEDNGTI